MHADRTKFLRFLAVGGFGFSVDATIFFSLVFGAGWSLLTARIIASLIAISATWLLNRNYTFQGSRRGSLWLEYIQYLISSAAGATCNLIALRLLSGFDAGMNHVPAYLFGTGVGLVVNFILYDRLVFNRRRKPL